MRRTATIAQTKTKGFTIRGTGQWRQPTLSDALETVTIQGFEWVRFRPLSGPSKLLTCDYAADQRFASDFDKTTTTQTP